MNLTDRKLKARKAFSEGYNCAQSVVVAFSDILNMDETALLSLSAPFGAGFGRSRNVCGTITAMGIVTGLLTDSDGKDIKKEKDDVYTLMQQLMSEFTAKNDTIICKDLLKNIKNLTSTPVSEPRTEEYYKVRPCIKFVEDSVEILYNYLLNKEIINE